MNAPKNLPEIPEKEKTPLVLELSEIIHRQSEEIQQLKKEISSLKNQVNLSNKASLKVKEKIKIDGDKNVSSGKTKKTLLKIFKYLVSFGILYYLFEQLDFDVLRSQFSKLGFATLALAFSILFIQCALSSLKWKLILTSEHIRPPFLYLFQSYLIGNFISLFLPSSFGGDIYRVYSLKKYNADFYQNTSSVLFDRISGLFALVTISIVSYTFFSNAFIEYRILAVYILGIIIFWILSSEKVLNRIAAYNYKIITLFLKILKSFNSYKKDKKIFISCLLISFVFQNNIVLLVKLYCSALNISINLEYLYIVVPLIYLTEALPISINGLGVREGAFAFFFVQGNHTKEEAIAVALLVITMRYFFVMTTGGTMFVKRMLLSGEKK